MDCPSLAKGGRAERGWERGKERKSGIERLRDGGRAGGMEGEEGSEERDGRAGGRERGSIHKMSYEKRGKREGR